MSLETKRVEIESYCGHCGERLPDLGDNRVGACPNCRQRFKLSGGAGAPPRESGNETARERGSETARERGSYTYRAEPGFFHYDPPVRDPLLAALLSAICPGLGQAYNGHLVKAFLVFMTCFLILPYFLGILDAFMSAKESNRIQPAVVRRGYYAGCR